jgi:hypothetical protein
MGAVVEKDRKHCQLKQQKFTHYSERQLKEVHYAHTVGIPIGRFSVLEPPLGM